MVLHLWQVPYIFNHQVVPFNHQSILQPFETHKLSERCLSLIIQCFKPCTCICQSPVLMNYIIIFKSVHTLSFFVEGNWLVWFDMVIHWLCFGGLFIKILKDWWATTVQATLTLTLIIAEYFLIWILSNKNTRGIPSFIWWKVIVWTSKQFFKS